MLLFTPKEFRELGLVEAEADKKRREDWLQMWTEEYSFLEIVKETKSLERLLWHPAGGNVKTLITSPAKLMSLHYGLKYMLGGWAGDSKANAKFYQPRTYWTLAKAYLGSDEALQSYYMAVKNFASTQAVPTKPLESSYEDYLQNIKGDPASQMRTWITYMSPTAEVWLYNTLIQLGYGKLPNRTGAELCEARSDEVIFLRNYAIWLDHVGTFCKVPGEVLRYLKNADFRYARYDPACTAEILAVNLVKEFPKLADMARHHSWVYSKLFHKFYKLSQERDGNLEEEECDRL